MWKKLLITLVTLLGTFSVGYAFYDMSMDAASSYLSGGSITGRINIAPNGISGANIGMQKGDKIYIGANNPYTNNPMGWQLLYYDNNYPLYDVVHNGSYTDIKQMTATLTQNGSASAWFVMTTENVGKNACFSSTPTYNSYDSNRFRTMKDITQYVPYTVIKNLEPEMQTAKSFNLTRPADLSVVPEVITKTASLTGTQAPIKQMHRPSVYTLAAMESDLSVFYQI